MLARISTSLIATMMGTWMCFQCYLTARLRVTTTRMPILLWVLMFKLVSVEVPVVLVPVSVSVLV